MEWKLLIAVCVAGLILTQVAIHEFKRDPNEYTELNFVFVIKEGDKNSGYTNQFDDPIQTTEEIFFHDGTWYTILEYADNMVLLATYPKKIAANELFTVSFEITNHVGKTWTYTYYIKVNEDLVKENSLTLRHEEKKEIREELEIASQGIKKVSVRLSTGEDIHFYVDVI